MTWSFPLSPKKRQQELGSNHILVKHKMFWPLTFFIILISIVSHLIIYIFYKKKWARYCLVFFKEKFTTVNLSFSLSFFLLQKKRRKNDFWNKVLPNNIIVCYISLKTAAKNWFNTLVFNITIQNIIKNALKNYK